MEKLDKNFEPKKREEEIYKNWEEKGYFHADTGSKKPSFSIVIPPPNITGSLHIGHGLDNTLQDIYVRYMRMSGFNTLWLPGTDHAGIATQNVIEKQLMAEGKTRQDIGREAFIERTWKWKEESGGRIINQLKRLGCSCDWQRTRFTMDEGLSNAVKKVFVDLYNEGLIYRDNYIINWCPRCLTALSDLEAEQKESDGKLYYVRYPSEDGRSFVTVATTRPETMLGDTAIAVNPSDKKYKKIIGKHCILPLVNRKILIIADERVEKDFGTGAVKVTPAHDFNDFEISKTHKLERINIFTDDGKVNEAGGPYKGLTILEAREKVVHDLKLQGLLVKTVKYKLLSGHCYRCKTTVEPRLSMQWFVRVKPLAEKAIDAVKKGKTRFIPKSWERTYFDWMENIRDWCISRQLWWGHRIPAWYCEDCKSTIVSIEDPMVCTKCRSQKLSRDTDVLDTWFSSSLWPFSTMGWPENTAELKLFYPTSLLVTSFDIIFFWVARMIMMGLKFMNEVPFKDVFIHALVRDEYGQKMSKSKGNVVDPLDIMDKFGTDAFRFTLSILSVQGRNISISEKRIVGYRNFVNKLWNASRFVLNSLDDSKVDLASINDLELSPFDKWIRTKLNSVTDGVHKALKAYKLNDAASLLYRFVWNEFCDWYIELSKRSFYSGTDEEKKATHTNLVFVLDRTLKLLHPFMPFVTEEIWLKLPKAGSPAPSIMISEFPKNDGFKDEKSFRDVEFLKAVINSIRNLRTENLIPPQKKINLIFNSKDKKKITLLKTFENAIKDLCFTEEITYEKTTDKISAKAIVKNIEILVPIEGLIDTDSEALRLGKEIVKSKEDVSFLEKRLNNEGYLKNASKELIKLDREKLELAKEKLSKLKESLKKIEELKA